MKEQENKRRALGMGLEQLFNSESLDFSKVEKEIVEETPKEQIVQIKLDELRSNPYQPRKIFDQEALLELSSSILEHGVFQPIIVKKSIKGYDIVAGERRAKASQMAGLETIPAIIRDFSDNEMMQIALLENLQREDLTCIEEATAYKTIIESLGITQEQLGQKLGKSRSHINNTIGLLRLPLYIQDLILYNKISMGHARVLSKLSDADKIKMLSEKIIDEGMSVRELEKLLELENYKNNPKRKSVKTTRVREYAYLEEAIREKLDTKVTINENRLYISFATKEDLNRILEILNITID